MKTLTDMDSPSDRPPQCDSICVGCEAKGHITYMYDDEPKCLVCGHKNKRFDPSLLEEEDE